MEWFVLGLAVLFLQNIGESRDEFSISETTLPWSLYGAMIGYIPDSETIVLMGGRRSIDDALNLDFIQINTTDLTTTTTISTGVTITNGTWANNTKYVMFDHRSVAVEDRVYYLDVSDDGMQLNWEVFSLSSLDSPPSIIPIDSWGWEFVVEGVTLCTDGDNRIFAAVLIVVNASYYSRCMEYDITNDVWYNLGELMEESSFGFYGSCAWQESTQELWLVGGRDYITGMPLSTVWTLNYTNVQLSQRGNLIIPRMASHTFLMKDSNNAETILVTGGCLQIDETTNFPRCAVGVIGSEIYNLIADSSSSLYDTSFGPHLSDPLAQISAIVRHEILWVFGGTSVYGNSQQIQYLDMSKTTWTQLMSPIDELTTIHVVNNIGTQNNSTFYETTSYDDAIEKAIWLYDDNTLDNTTTAGMSIYFPSVWTPSSSGRHFKWCMSNNVNVRIDCAVLDTCTFISDDNVLVDLMPIHSDQLKIQITIQNLVWSVTSGQTNDSNGQLLTVLFADNPGNFTLEFALTNVKFLAQFNTVYGVWIESGVGNNVLILNQITTSNTYGSFLQLVGSPSSIWNAEFSDMTILNHFSDAISIVADSIMFLSGIDYVLAERWTINSAYMSTAVYAYNFGVMYLVDINISSTVSAQVPIFARAGSGLLLSNIQCHNSNGTAACIFLSGIGTVEASDVNCNNTLSTYGCMGITGLDSITLNRITCADSIGYTGCVYADTTSAMDVSDVHCINSGQNGLLMSSIGCIGAYSFGTMNMVRVTCDSVYGRRIGCILLDSAFSMTTVQDITCQNSWGLYYGCLLAKDTSNSGNYTNEITLTNIQCHQTSCVDGWGGWAGCVGMKQASSGTINGLICDKTSGYSGCLYATRVFYLTITDLECTNTYSIFTACALLGSYMTTLTRIRANNTLGEHGSAVDTSSIKLIVSDSEFIDNTMGEFAINFGVGLHIQTQDPALVIGCRFIRNSGPFAGGGMSSTMTTGGSIDIVNCMFIDNNADKFGGAYFHNLGQLTFTNCTFNGNFANQGGAIGILAPGYMITMRGCTFENNFASAQGGAIFISQGNYHITDTICTRNIAKSDGGCLFDGDGYVVCQAVENLIKDSEITYNHAQQGAGLYIHGCRLAMHNVDILNNTASQTGGGIMIDVSDGFHNLTNIRLVENVAGSSGGAVSLTGGNILLSQCTIQKNTATTLAGGVYLAHSARWGMQSTISNSELVQNMAENGGAIGLSSSALASDFEWDDSPILTLKQSNVSENHATTNGGAIEVQLGTLSMHSNNIRNNIAGMEGGGIHISQGWLQDRNTEFNSNRAETGGGMSCDIPEIELLNTNFYNNSASNGGAAWLLMCPLYSFQTEFVNNSAKFSGGAIYVDEQGECEVCNRLNDSCYYFSNQAAVGSDAGTGPQLLVFSNLSNVDVDQKVEISLKGTLFNAYGSVMTQLERTTVLSAAIVGDQDVILTGRFEDTFEQGKASLAFYVIPGDTIHHTDTDFDLTIQVKTDTYKFNKTFLVHFSNSVYTPQGWTIGINSAVGIIGIVSVIVTAVLMWWYRDAAIIRGSTPPFLVVILFGCLLLSISIILLPFIPYDAPCQLLPWLLHFSFVYILAPITGKTWRIYMIFYMAKQRFQRFTFTTWRLALLFIIAPSVVIFVYLLVWTVTQKNWTKWEIQSDGVNKEYCSLDSIFLTVSLACGLLLIIWLVRLAYGVKDVPKNFNESFWLGAAIYTLALIMAFMIPISVISSVPPEAKQTLGGIASWIALEAVLAFIYWRKYYMIWFHAEEMKNHTEKSSEDSNMSSTDSSNMAASDLSTDKSNKSKTTGSKTGNTIQARDTLT